VVDDPVQDGRNPMAHGYVLASRVMSMGLQMVVPLGVGWWIDSVIHTRYGVSGRDVGVGSVGQRFGSIWSPS